MFVQENKGLEVFEKDEREAFATKVPFVVLTTTALGEEGILIKPTLTILPGRASTTSGKTDTTLGIGGASTTRV